MKTLFGEEGSKWCSRCVSTSCVCVMVGLERRIRRHSDLPDLLEGDMEALFASDQVSGKDKPTLKEEKVKDELANQPRTGGGGE